MNKFCHNCGDYMTSVQRFCKSCGNEIIAMDSTSSKEKYQIKRCSQCKSIVIESPFKYNYCENCCYPTNGDDQMDVDLSDK